MMGMAESMALRALIAVVVGVVAGVTVLAVLACVRAPSPFGFYTSCPAWIAVCAQHRPLADCRLDAAQLGCDP